MCFLPNSILRTDFEEMFRDVITREMDFSAAVLKRLVDGAKSAYLKAVEAVAKSQNHKAAVAELTGGFRVTRIRHDLIFYREDEK